MRKRVIVSVINDLITDQRVHKVCDTLNNMGFDVLLIGRKLRESPEMDKRDYALKRMRLLFEKGPLFYAEFNLRLFVFLISHKVNMLVSNDLDTLLPNYLVSKLKRVPLVYDSHEYFTQVPELVERKHIQSIWKFIERMIFPKLTDVITVNDSIAELYEQDYGIRPVVVRNIPRVEFNIERASRKELGLPDKENIIILQGSGINIDRGSEELVEAMPMIKNAVLLIVGGGDVIGELKNLVTRLGIGNRVIFKPRMPYSKLMQYTSSANLGVTFDKPTNINYKYSLPNKLFDYIRAGVPVISSDLPEIRKVIEKYDIGDFISDHRPEAIADKINSVFANEPQLSRWKKNCSFAAQELTWENEELTLFGIYKKYV